jgi:hypothetical protein
MLTGLMCCFSALECRLGLCAVGSERQDGQLHRAERGRRSIWEIFKTPQDIDAVCAQLLDELEVAPENGRAEIEAFLKETDDACCGCA